LSLAIANMQRSDLDLALEWAAREGWNPGLNDAAVFHQTDPAGFFVARRCGEPVAFVSAVRYGNEFGFMGFYLVCPEHRNKGYGGRVALEGLRHLAGVTVGLDGVEAQQANYARHGFQMAHANFRYEGKGPAASPGEGVAALTLEDLEALAAYDRQHFPAERREFLAAWVRQPGALALGLTQDGRLCGYGVRRPCRVGHKIAPLFAETPAHAATLLAALRAGLHAQESFYLDLPGPNGAAVQLAAAAGMNPVFRTARMYLGPAPALPLERIYGITSFELG
jgi:predicted N-acetyltransferase YhbS